MLRVFVLAFVLAAAATAGAGPRSEGAKLFEEGRSLAKAGKYADACDRFERSLKLDPAIGTQLNYADCHEKLGRNAEAWRLFDGAADAEKMTNPTRAKFARERADALLPKLGVIVLHLETPDVASLSIKVAGRTLEATAVVREIVDPGSISILVRAPGAAAFEDVRAIGAGETVSIDVPAFETTEDEPGASTTRRRKSRVYLAYGVGGAGALSLVTGVVVGMIAKSRYEDQFAIGECQDADPRPTCTAAGAQAQNRALDLASVGTVLGVGGLVLLAGGAVLYVTSPRDLVVTPSASAQSVGVSVVGSF